jgi:hypothetical protein
LGQGAATNQARNTSDKADKNLKSSARINPSTLAMEFDVPLASFPGRNGNSLSSSLSYSSKVWRMDESGSYWYNLPLSCNTQHVSQFTPRFGERSLSGWTSNFVPPIIEEKLVLYKQDGEPYNTGLEEGLFNSTFANAIQNFIPLRTLQSPLSCGWGCTGVVNPHECQHSGNGCECANWTYNS